MEQKGSDALERLLYSNERKYSEPDINYDVYDSSDDDFLNASLAAKEALERKSKPLEKPKLIEVEKPKIKEVKVEEEEAVEKPKKKIKKIIPLKEKKEANKQLKFKDSFYQGFMDKLALEYLEAAIEANVKIHNFDDDQLEAVTDYIREKINL